MIETLDDWQMDAARSICAGGAEAHDEGLRVIGECSWCHLLAARVAKRTRKPMADDDLGERIDAFLARMGRGKESNGND